MSIRGKAICAAIVILVFTAGIRLTTNQIQSTDNSQTTAEKLLQYQTDYVGDASKVGNIVSQLDFPSEVTFDHIELDTEAPPYGVTVCLKTDATTGNLLNEVSNQQPFEKNAIIMFSLIDNVDKVRFGFDDGKDNSFIEFSRQGANESMGRDVREFSQGKDKLEQLLNSVDQKTKG